MTEDVSLARVRQAIIDFPELVLDDQEVINALIRALSRDQDNVVDFQHAILKKVQNEALTQAAMTVELVSNAEYSFEAMQSVHYCILEMLDAQSITDFLNRMAQTAQSKLFLDSAQLWIVQNSGRPSERIHDALTLMPLNEIVSYCGKMDKEPILRGLAELNEEGKAQSEAIVPLFKQEEFWGILLLRASGEQQFSEDMGVEILEFYAQSIAKQLQYWTKRIKL